MTASAAAADSKGRSDRAGADRPRTVRSKVTNGSRTFLGSVSQSRISRRWRDLHAGFAAEAGEPLTDETTRWLVCRAATLSVQLEIMEAAIANGEVIDAQLYGRLVDRLSRTTRRLRGGRRGRSRASPPTAIPKFGDRP